MKTLKLLGWSSALCLSTIVAQAQETNEIDSLKQQLRQMQENFERVQREQRSQIEALTRKVEQLTSQPATVQSKSAEQKRLEEQLAAELSTTVDQPIEKKAWRPTDPIRIGNRSTFMDIGLVGTFAAGGSTADDIEGGLQLGGHDPNQNGFTVQAVEATFSGTIDPYFRGNANILFSLDSGGESFIELEEAWLETASLPANLQIRAGQYLTEFGRQNTMHPHSWAFVDAPLVNARLLGPDGLRNPGARISWLAPTPFYSELFLGIQNSHGETAASFRGGGGHLHGEDESALPFGFRHSDNDRGISGLDDLLLSPRYVMSVDLSDTQTILGGVSASFGPNASGESGRNRTELYGLDLTWKWKSAHHEAGFPFVAWQTEGILRRYKAGAFDWDEAGNGGDDDGNGLADEGMLVDGTTGLPAAFGRETLTDYGFYTQLSYGFRKGWVGGVRFDYLIGEQAGYERLPLLLADNMGGGMAVGRDPLRNDRWRISPNLTWYPSEFSKVRLQYNYDNRRDIGVDHSVWLQLEFVLGAHAAHKF